MVHLHAMKSKFMVLAFCVELNDDIRVKIMGSWNGLNAPEKKEMFMQQVMFYIKKQKERYPTFTLFVNTPNVFLVMQEWFWICAMFLEV